jgi:hypothetical protein
MNEEDQSETHFKKRQQRSIIRSPLAPSKIEAEEEESDSILSHILMCTGARERHIYRLRPGYSKRADQVETNLGRGAEAK